MSNIDLPNAWVRGLVHRASLACPHCEGKGQVETVGDYLSIVEDCKACGATGRRDVGCGGALERDLNHALAYCLQEDCFVPLEEAPWPKDVRGK